MVTVQQRRVEAQRESPNYTPAQRVRQKHTQRRRLKNDRVLSPFRAILETCILADEVREDMLEVGLDPAKDKLFCAIVIRHNDGELKGRTVLLEPSPEGISQAMQEIAPLKDVTVLGSIFRLYDLKAGVSRNWGRPFLSGQNVRNILERALREQERQEKPMTWIEAARKVTPISLRMATAWAHPDGRVVNLPWESETTRESLAEVELKAEGFGPVHILALIPDEIDGLKIRVITIPALGTAERVLAIAVQPTAVHAFAQQAKADGIAGESELSN